MRYLGLFLSVWVLAAVSVAHAKNPKPLFEAGISGGAGYIPDYPAAGQSRIHGLIFPVFQFRGQVFRSDDEDGTHARIFKNSDLSFDLSFGGSFPADSKRNDARRGMPDLDWIGEVGPRIHARLLGDDDHFLRVSLATRMAFSTDFTRLDYRGLILAPVISTEHQNWLFKKISVMARLSPQWASRELHEYFYSVQAPYANDVRSEYHASSGYLGTSAYLVFAFERPVYQIFSGFGATFYDGAANAKSPLFKDRVNEAVFLAFRWYFYRSEENGHI